MEKVEMTKVFVDLLAAVLLICIPAVTKCAVRCVNRTVDRYEAESKNKKVAMILREITASVQTAVTAVNQVYVDSIKKSDAPFTKAAQSEAFQRAYKTALSLLSEDAKRYISQTYGNVEEYLTVNIEAEVRKQKHDVQTLQAAEVVTE